MYCWSHILRFAYLEDENAAHSLAHLFHCQQASVQQIHAIAATTASNHLQQRLITQAEGLARAFSYTDGTNNLAERELRSIVIARKISFGSASFPGFQNRCITASIIQTYAKKSSFISDLATTLTAASRIPIPKQKPPP